MTNRETAAAVSKTSPKRASKITLDSSVDIGGVVKLQGKLKKCAGRCANVELNAQKVTTIDTAGLQLLLAFVKQLKEDGNSVKWRSPSEALTSIAKLTGMRAELGLK